MRREDIDYRQEAQQPKKKSRKYLVTSTCAIVILLFAGVGVWLYMNRANNSLPKNVTNSVAFPIYYPSKLSKGYELDKSTAKDTGDIVFFTLKDKERQIVFSEQAAPPNPPDFDAIQKAYSSLKKTSITGGQGIIGTYQETPTAIVLTNTTLINISASKDTPQDIVIKLVQNLQSLPN